MSKLAHQRAYEQYPQGNDGSSARIGYTLGYDQAFQDFLKKACEWLSKNARNYYSAYATSDKLIDDFRRIMLEKE